MIDIFFTNGFCILNEPRLEFQDDMCKILGEKYLSLVFSKWTLVELKYAEKIHKEDKITEWHNDSKFGGNLTFLYYIDEMTENIGGAIEIDNGTKTFKIYPKYGTLIMMSQKSNMKHRVEYT
jgi:hypothetical protein